MCYLSQYFNAKFREIFTRMKIEHTSGVESKRQLSRPNISQGLNNSTLMSGVMLHDFSSIDTPSIECLSCSSESITPLTFLGDASPHSPLQTEVRRQIFREGLGILSSLVYARRKNWAKGRPCPSCSGHAKNESNACLVAREKWPTQSKVQRFFSWPTAMQRKDQCVPRISLDEEKDVQCVHENSERQDLID